MECGVWRVVDVKCEANLIDMLLLLMLEDRDHGPRFTISLKRSAQNLQLSTSWPADYRISRHAKRKFRSATRCIQGRRSNLDCHTRTSRLLRQVTKNNAALAISSDVPMRLSGTSDFM